MVMKINNKNPLFRHNCLFQGQQKKKTKQALLTPATVVTITLIRQKDLAMLTAHGFTFLFDLSGFQLKSAGENCLQI